MRRIAVLGGGRWARVHISVLRTLTEPGDAIYWLTRHNAAENRAWLTQNACFNVDIKEDKEAIWALRPTAITIATATPTHAILLQKALDQRVPVLCEKPFALDMKTAVRLVEQSQVQNTIAGVNLEFLCANYLHDFAQMLKTIAITSIEVVWHDPIEEIRHGEVKKADSDTPHMHDALPHCWSVLQTLLPNKPLQIRKVTIDKQNVLVSATCMTNSLPVTFLLSRTAPARQRVISINHGMAVLNFTTEPGVTILNGKASQNVWRGDRPMAGAIGSFLKQLDVPTDTWPLSLAATLPAVALAEQGHAMLLQTNT